MSEQLLERNGVQDQKIETEEAHVFEAIEEGKKTLQTQRNILNYEIEQKKNQDKEHGINSEFIPIREAQYKKEAYLKEMDLRYYKEQDGENPERRIYNKDGAKHLIKDAIVDAYESKNKENLARYARFAIDINGLKAVNDLAGHEVGDVFLNRAVEQLTATKETLRAIEFKDDKGKVITLERIEVSHEGGDEFGLFIETNIPMPSEVAKQMAAHISKGLEFDCDDLLTNEIIKEKGGIEEEPPVDKDGNPYRFKASAGVGVATFKEVLINPGTKEELELRKEEMAASRGIAVEDLSKEDIKNLLMGMILDETDARMIENKKECKASLDPFEQKLLLRNEEMKLMHDRFVFLNGEMERLQTEVGNLQQNNKELSVNLAACTGALEQYAKNVPDITRTKTA